MTDALQIDKDLEDQVFATIVRNIGELMPGVDTAQISIAGKMADYGCNSIDRMDIVWKTLDDLQLDIPITQFSAVHDLRSLVRLLCSFMTAR
ncbi:hypothetical protein GCM10027093_27100 [Paraburkholderia jirisanensis]